jgi:hypothetical protein
MIANNLLIELLIFDARLLAVHLQIFSRADFEFVSTSPVPEIA